ncbi:MAG TPA: DUF4340 domain-containing protein, partial [Acidimicrobiia bacterium]|nr:DUF4340 domain-containing protein [Acidimicrobiia bacterium]
DYLLERLAPLPSARTFSAGDPAAYGLAAPELEFELERGGGAVTTVAVGNRDLEGSLRYVSVPGRDSVEMISAQIVDDLMGLVAGAG